MEVIFGECGQDSKNFVHELTSAYVRYAVRSNHNTELLATSEGHTVLKVTGKDVYKAFSHERRHSGNEYL